MEGVKGGKEEGGSRGGKVEGGSRGGGSGRGSGRVGVLAAGVAEDERGGKGEGGVELGEVVGAGGGGAEALEESWDSREAESVTRDMASVMLSGMASSTMGLRAWKIWPYSWAGSSTVDCTSRFRDLAPLVRIFEGRLHALHVLTPVRDFQRRLHESTTMAPAMLRLFRDRLEALKVVSLELRRNVEIHTGFGGVRLQ